MLFIYFRTPVSDDIDWPLYNESKPIYHVWNADKLDVGYGPRATECQFWNGFFPKIGIYIVFVLKIKVYIFLIENHNTNYNIVEGDTKVIDFL